MIEQILKDSAYKLSQFKQNEISAIEEKIYKKSNNKFYMKCLIRDKEIQLKPEEVIRQLFIYKLLNQYGYKKSQVKVEHGINFGHEVKRADIVIVNKDHADAAYIIVEVKRPNIESGEEQLKSYCHVSGAPVAVWTNGEKIAYWTRQDENIFVDIPDIPNANQTLEEMQAKLWYIPDLIENDILSKGNTTLSKLIKELEDEVLANAGVDAFEEVFKLIFSKLYDEYLSGNDEQRHLHFRNYIVYKDSNEKGAKEYNDEQNKKFAQNIQKLFNGAKKEWAGVFTDEDKIELTPSHLAICISKLQNAKLFNSNLEVIDEAFEHLMSKIQKAEKCQFFTPRYVIDMCVKMLNPKRNETMIDTAAGSCGFPVHTIFHVCGNKFTNKKKSQQDIDYVRDNIFAIDFDEKAVRVARTLNLIAGDGKTNVIRLNTLDYRRWGEVVSDKKWQKKYSQGWLKLDDLCEIEDDYQNFNFDIVMANPPFAGDVKEKEILQNYELAKKSDGKYQTKMSRDVLFIERNLQFLKPGGRMAIVLPQGRFNNSSDKYIRDFIAERCRILAVVGLHGNVFKPHTGTKTSVLFVQKWDDKLCPYCEDYKIFFATMQKPSKDNSGEKIYVTTAEGSPLRDKHNHLIVDHDLFNHDGLTADGIAEAFKKFAEQENLSFFDSSSFDEVHYKNLLEGLECTEIFLSEVLKASNGGRIDSHFFEKKYLQSVEKVIQHKTFLLKDIVTKKISTGHTPSMKVSEYYGGTINFIKTDNLREGYIKTPFNDYLTESGNDVISNTKLKVGDVVVTIIGADENVIARTALITEEFLPANINQNIALIRVNQNIISPEFLTVYLNSKFGKNFLYYYARQTEQFNLNCEEVGLVQVPIFSDKFVSSITEIVQRKYFLLKSADEVYKSAEKLLAQALQLEDFKPSAENTAIKNFSASFAKTGRLDAEFFMPKYDDIENKLAEFPQIKIKDLIKYPVCSGSTPKAGDKKYYADEIDGVPFIRAVDIVQNRVDTKNFIYIKPEVHNEILKRTKLKKNDVLFSIAGTVGRCGIFDYDFEANINQAIAILRFSEEKIKRLYLIQFFNSEIGKLYVEKYSRQGVQTNLNLDEVSNLSVPIIDAETQGKIAALVEKSFNLRAESERLLEVAKSAVEIAIESGEDVAIKFLNRGENIGD